MPRKNQSFVYDKAILQITQTDLLVRSVMDLADGYACCQMIFNDGSPDDFRFVIVNRAFETLLGLTNVLGKTASQVIPGLQESDPALLAAFGRVAQTGKPETLEIYVCRFENWFSIALSCPQEGCFVAVFNIITEKRRLSKALEENEKRLRQVLENSLDAAYRRNLQTNEYEYFSPVIERLTGYSFAEMQHFNLETVLDFIHPEDRPQVVSLLQKSQRLSSAGSIVLEYRFRCKNGSYVWFQDKFMVEFNPEGIPVALVGSLRDVTARKAAEESARASAAKYEILLENSRDGIHVLDQDGRVVQVNQAFCEMLGYTRDELLGMNVQDWDDQWHGEDLLAKVRQLIWRPAIFETSYRCKNGEVRQVEINAAGVHLTGRDFLFAAARDISERKEMERQVQARMAAYRAIIDASPVPKAINDDQQHIILVNAAFTQTFGYELADIPTLADWWPKAYPDPEYRQQIVSAWQKRLQKSEETGASFQPLEIKIHCKDGSTKTALATASQIPQAPVGQHLVVLYDISDRILAEEQLRASELRFHQFAEQSGEGIVILDEDGRVMDWNPGIAKITGLSADQVIGKEFVEIQELMSAGIVPPDRLARQKLAIQQAVKTGDAPFLHKILEGSIKSSTGKISYVQQIVFTMKTDRGFRVGSMTRDVTDIKLAEAALRESEARFRHMADTAPVLIWTSGTNAACDYFNQSWLTFTGRTMEQELGNGWAEGVHPDDFQQCLNIYMDSFGKRIEFQMEYRLRRADGEFRWILDHGVPRFTLEGRFLGYIGSCVDISEIKLVEGALRESEQRLLTIFQTSPIPIAVTTYGSNLFIDVNEAFEHLTGFTRAEILGHTSEDLDLWIDPELRSQYKANLLDGVPVRNFELRMRTKNGQVAYVILQAEKIELAGQACNLITGLDITSRKKVEEELQTQRDFANQIINLMGQGLTVTNAQGNFEFVNPAYAAMTGYALENLIGKHPLDIAPLEERQTLIEQRKIRQAGQPGNYETRLIRADGGMSPVLISSVPRTRNVDGESYGAVAVITDLSRQKEIEQELRSAKQALEEALEREKLLSQTDSLTGVNNRRQLFALAEDRLTVALRYEQPLSVIMFDIDHFKQVNDLYGHDVGDQVLIQVVKAAQAGLRASDVIGRYGGEEFIIVLPMTTAAQAFHLAERIRQNVCNLQVETEKGVVRVTMSLGVVDRSTQKNPNTVETLFRMADLMMYGAKAAGRNRTQIMP